MLLGILSDSHDRYDTMKQAVELLQSRGAAFLIHCGDVGSPRMLDLLAGLPSAFVWGNCDWDRPALARHADTLDVPCYGACGELELGGKKIALLHGDDPLAMQLALKNKPDYLFHGHTHVRHDHRIGPTRIINPGALFRAAEKTVALLDTASDKLEFIHIA